MRSTLLVFAAVLVAAPGAAAQQSAAETITAEDIAARIGLLAHDSMAGRFTPSPELDRAARYIADEFRRLGLEPAGDDDGFIQTYRLARRVPDTTASWLRLGAGPSVRFGGDAIQVSGRDEPAPVHADIILLTGTVPPATMPDLEGRVVLAAVPVDADGRANPRARALLRAVMAARPAALLIPTAAGDSAWARLVARAFGAPLAPVWRASAAAPEVYVRDAAVAAALAASGVVLADARSADAAAAFRPLPETITFSVRSEERDAIATPNVAGLLRGSDPALRDEVVVFSAHMDHVGVTGRGRCRTVGTDSVCNGADDNASGTTSVLELAEAFAAMDRPPRRSMLFVAVSGEERGLWGSDYFAAHPPVPVTSMVADLNIDMVGRNWRDTVVAIGRSHSDLGATLDRVQTAHPELGMTAVDDLWPGERFYFRSDHYNFARRGVPILFFFTGTHPDYHRPSDEPAAIDAEKQARITRLLYYLGVEIADAPERPRWVPDSYREIVETP